VCINSGGNLADDKNNVGYKKCKIFTVVFKIEQKQEGNADPALKPDFHIFLLIFQHK